MNKVAPSIRIQCNRPEIEGELAQVTIGKRALEIDWYYRKRSGDYGIAHHEVFPYRKYPEARNLYTDGLNLQELLCWTETAALSERV